MCQWQSPTTYDVVVAIFVQFVGPADRPVLFGERIKAVKPGGLLLMQGYAPQQIARRTGGPPWKIYTPPNCLRKEFSSWEILELREHEDMLAEGAGRNGRSALIDLKAREPLAVESG